MANDFVQSLRMANIYGPSGNPSLSAPTSDIDPMRMVAQFHPYLIEEEKQKRRYEQDMMAKQHAMRLQEIAAAAAQHPSQSASPTQGMNTVYQPSISDLQKANLALKSRDLDIKQQRESDLANVQNRRENIRADMNSLHDLTDSQKLQMINEGRSDLAGQRADAAMKLQTEKGKEKTAEIGQRGTERRKTLEQQGNQNLSSIAARIQGQMDVKQTPNAVNMTPSATATDLKNKARELQLTRPDVGQYIVSDDKGNPTISPNAPPAIRDIITNHLYSGGDVSLPSDKQDDKKSDTKPASKYSVSVSD